MKPATQLDGRHCFCGKQLPSTVGCRACGKPLHRACYAKFFSTVEETTCASCLVGEMDPLTLRGQVLADGWLLPHQGYSSFEYKVGQQIEIRCIKMDKDYLTVTTWPCFIDIVINHEKVFSAEPIKRQSALKRRKDQPLLWSRLQPFAKRFNNLLVTISCLGTSLKDELRIDQVPGVYFLQVATVEQLDEPTAIAQYMSCALDVGSAIQRLVCEFNGDPSPESVTVSLTCPLSMARITVPARGHKCKHYSVFCLQKVFKFLRLSRKWRCPLCSLPINRPQVDLFLLRQLSDPEIKQLVFTRRDAEKLCSQERPVPVKPITTMLQETVNVIEIQDNSKDLVISIEEEELKGQVWVDSRKTQLDRYKAKIAAMRNSLRQEGKYLRRGYFYHKNQMPGLSRQFGGQI